MRDCNVVANGIEDEIPDSDVKCIYKEVVVIGNGPSGIALSYILSGHRPYYNRIPHPDPMLSARLIECTQKSLLHQDLSFLSQGIEGRSKNPISLLIDAMTHPGADMGLEWPSLLTWKKTTKSVDHIVIGKGDPGGTWPGIAGNVLTISPGRWMSLPGLEFEEYHDKRAPASAVAKYYMDYIKKHDLTANMASQSTVTTIQPFTCKSRRRARWKVWVNDANGGTISYECRHLVLATGASDKAGCLGVPGESLPFVTHDLKAFEEQISLRKEEIPAPFYISDAVVQAPDGEDNHSPMYRRKDKSLVKTKSNSYLHSTGNGSYNNHAVSWISSHGLSDQDKEEKEEGIHDLGFRDVRNGIGNASVGDRDGYLSEFIDKHKQISEVKTSDNVFKEDDNIWFDSDIPKEKEIDLSLSKLAINNGDFVIDDEDFFCENMDDEEKDKVLVVGAGLSAADAILAAWNKNCSVVHAFRSPVTTTQLPAVMYPEYHELYQLMQGLATRNDYHPLPGHQIIELNKDNTVRLVDSSGKRKKVKVHAVAILIGSQPDLFFLPKSLKNLGIDVNKPVDCKVNPIQIDPFSYKCVRAPPGLYALGPLVGDNFVRFLQGGAVAVAGHIFKDNNLHKGL